MLRRTPMRRAALLISCGLSCAHRLAVPTVPRWLVARAPLCTASISTSPTDDTSLPFRSLAFYAIAPIDTPEQAVDRHKAFLSARGMVGRVYLCGEGMNAQVSGTSDACAAYREFVTAELPEPPLFKEDSVAEPSFPRLRVKLKALVPEVEGGVDLAQRGEDLEPEAWAEMLADSSLSKLVLDVRNEYEWDVGRFDGAARPEGITDFADTSAAAFGLPTDAAAKAETPVMMYCTGGIRCEYFSAALKQQGYQKVYKLKGGVQHYGNTMARKGAGAGAGAGEGAVAGEGEGEVEGEGVREGAGGSVPHWKGSLFVFDRRNTVPMGEGGAEVVGRCYHCNAPTEAFINCCNMDCNRLHLVCEPCLAKHQGFCEPACAVAPRRRLLSLALADRGDKPLDLAAVLATTQGPAPNAPDVNRLATVKPHNVPRHEYDADKHGQEHGQKLRATDAQQQEADPVAAEG